MKDFTYKNKHIGKLINNVFTKKVNKSKHFMKIYNSWGIDKSVINQLNDDTLIIYIDEKLQTSWLTDKKTWVNNCLEKDWGHGVQLFLDEKYFTKKDNNQKSLF